jgi:hypothetical protein
MTTTRRKATKQDLAVTNHAAEAGILKGELMHLRGMGVKYSESKEAVTLCLLPALIHEIDISAWIAGRGADPSWGFALRG